MRLGLLLLLAALPPNHHEPEVRARLDNGLRVVIVPNRLAPVATTVTNYLAGSNETPTGFPGTAHAMEHMMFRGSPGELRLRPAEHGQGPRLRSSAT